MCRLHLFEALLLYSLYNIKPIGNILYSVNAYLDVLYQYNLYKCIYNRGAILQLQQLHKGRFTGLYLKTY